MSWEDYSLARKVLLEEHIGAPVRESKRMEDAAAKKTRSQVARGAR